MSKTVKKLTFTALLAALIAVCAQIAIPLPNGVPVTLQIFAVVLCGYLLGPKYGALAALVYLLLGAVGAPVFSGFRGGAHVLAGKTGGYLWGYAPMAALCGLRCVTKSRRRVLPWLWGVPGLLVCHLLGTLQNMLLAGGGFWALLLVYSVPYLAKDLACVGVAAFFAARLSPVLARYGVSPGVKTGS